MSTQEHDIVDTIAQAPDGSVTLIMTEHREWKDISSMLADIERKLSAYVTFVTSGGLAAQTTLKPSSKITIDLTCKYDPPASVQRLFEEALAFTTSKKIDFTVSHLFEGAKPAKRVF